MNHGSLATTRTLRALIAATFLALSLIPLTTAHEEDFGVPKPTMTSSSDEARIRVVIADQLAAWNAGDAKAFAASFAEDVSFTNICGSIVFGRLAFKVRREVKWDQSSKDIIISWAG